MKTGDELEDFFRQRLSGHEEEPPENAWAGIKRDIPKRRPALWWLPVVLLLLIAVPALMYLPQLTTTAEMAKTTASEAGSEISTIDQAETPVSKADLPGSELPENNANKNSRTGQTASLKQEQNTVTEGNTNITGSQSGALANGLPVAGLASDSTLENPDTQPGSSPESRPAKTQLHILPVITHPVKHLAVKPADTAPPEQPATVSHKGEQIRPETRSAGKGTTEADVAFSIAALTPDVKAPVAPTENENGTGENLPPNGEDIDEDNERPNSLELLALLQPELLVPAPELAVNLVLALPQDSVISAEEKRPVSSAYSFGAYVSPRYTFLRFAPNTEDDQYISVLSNKNFNNPQRFGYEAGVTVTRKVKRVELEGCLVFSKLSESLVYNVTQGAIHSYQAVNSTNQSVTVAPEYAFDQRQYVSQYYYGGVKGGLGYTVLQMGSTRIRAVGGFGANMLIKGITRIYQNGTWVETTEAPSADNPLRSANLNLYAGIGYAHSLSQKVEMEVAPVLNYFLGSTYRKEQPFGLKPYTAGINVAFRLRK